MTELEKIKVILDIDLSETDEDNVLTILLEDVEQDVLTYTNRKEIRQDMRPLIRDIVKYRYHMRDSEHLSSSSVGITENYLTSLPTEIQKRLNHFYLNPICKR